MNKHAPTGMADTEDLEAVKSEIRARRDEFEAKRHVPKDMVAKLKGLGVYRAFVPKVLGGDEISPADFCRLIEELSKADASTGWVASFGVGAAYLAALPRETFEEIYGANPNLTYAGAIFPPQPATRTEDGFIVSGRWPYCSGCMGAELIGNGILDDATEGGLPRIAVMPADRLEIDEVWDTVGLCGTGSHDVVADKIFVPDAYTFVRGGAPQRDEPIYRYPSMALAAQVLAVVGLGTAQEAIDYIKTDVAGTKSITGAPTAATRPYLQTELAKAQATLSSARSFFYDAIETAWEQILRGDPVSREAHIDLRLAATTAAQGGAEAARIAFQIGGTSAIVRGHLLNRCMIDAAAVAQHAFMGVGTWTAAGAATLDQPTPAGYP